MQIRSENENTGEILENTIVVRDPKTVSRLMQKNYGIKERDFLSLELKEALFLMINAKLKVFKGRKELSEKEFIAFAGRKEKDFYQKYLVYEDLRKRGHVVKTGLKFGFDLRIYPKDKSMDEAHSEYVVQLVNENRPLKINELSRMVRMSQTIKTKLLLAVLDNEHNVTYFYADRALLQ